MKLVVAVFIVIVALGILGAVFHYNFATLLHEALLNTEHLLFYVLNLLLYARYLQLEYEHSWSPERQRRRRK
jgi:hypothetical protein